VSVVYGTTANVAGAAIRIFRIGPSLSNRIGMSDSKSNLEASQVRTLTHSPHKADKPASWYLFYSRKADIAAFLNMSDTPKAEILACPCINYPHNACILAGSIGLLWLLYGDLGAKGLRLTKA